MTIKKRLLLCIYILCGSVLLFISSCHTGSAGLEEKVSASITVRNLPTTITSIILTISADDLETIPPIPIPPTETSLTIVLPEGNARTFALTVLPDPGSLITSYSGEVTEDLIAGEAKEIDITLSLDGTKLLIPDYLNNRVVLINDMTGAGWVDIGYLAAGFSFLSDFKPYDVDFDNQGRMYIGNNYGGSGMGKNRIVRMDDALGTNRIDFSEISYDNGVTAIAVDRINNLVYYASLAFFANEKLLWSNLDGTNPTSLAVDSGVEAIQDIYGMDIDDNGILYIAGKNASGQPRIFRYNPATETVTHVYSTNLADPRDVVYKDGSVYVANKGGADGYKILKLDSATISTLEGSYGVDAPTENRNKGYFYEPWRFVAIRNRKLYIIDDDYDGVGFNTLEKLVAMDDMAGTDWDTFKPEDIGESPFAFYFAC